MSEQEEGSEVSFTLSQGRSSQTKGSLTYSSSVRTGRRTSSAGLSAFCGHQHVSVSSTGSVRQLADKLLATLRRNTGDSRSPTHPGFPVPKEDKAVNTDVTYQDLRFVCSTCRRPPKLPGLRHGPRLGVPRKAKSRRGVVKPAATGAPDEAEEPELRRTFSGAIPDRCLQTSGPSSGDGAVLGDADFSGLWTVEYEDLSAVAEWLQVLYIDGDEVVDGIGKRTRLVPMGGLVYLEGGALSLYQGRLSRQGKSGCSLSFSRAAPDEERGFCLEMGLPLPKALQEQETNRTATAMSLQTLESVSSELRVPPSEASCEHTTLSMEEESANNSDGGIQ